MILAWDLFGVNFLFQPCQVINPHVGLSVDTFGPVRS